MMDYEPKDEYSGSKLIQRNKYINGNLFQQKKRSTEREYERHNKNSTKLISNDYFSRRSTQKPTDNKNTYLPYKMNNSTNNRNKFDGYKNLVFNEKLMNSDLN